MRIGLNIVGQARRITLPLAKFRTMTFSLKHWSRLHTVNAVALHERWLTNPDAPVSDALLDTTRFNMKTGVWTVENEIELVRLLGALQWHNPGMKLWFRGEAKYYRKALPKRVRVKSSEAKLTNVGIKWLDSVAHLDRALRDRGALARAAILQHYGCPTSLLDVSSSYDVACAFSFAEGDTGKAHLRVYALPRHQHAVTVFGIPDVVLVDLSAELPSYCARPHVQQAAFIARREAVYNDIEGKVPVRQAEADVDPLCIAHIRLQFKGAARFYKPRKATATLYPKAGLECSRCKTKRPDMNNDYLLHILDCFQSPQRLPKPARFPDLHP